MTMLKAHGGGYHLKGPGPVARGGRVPNISTADRSATRVKALTRSASRKRGLDFER